MSFVFYVFLLFIDEIQLGVCQTAVLDIAVFSTVFRIVFLYRCRYVWIIRSGLCMRKEVQGNRSNSETDLAGRRGNGNKSPFQERKTARL